MPRDYPSAQSKALHKIQIASMRERLKLDQAKTRKAIADAPDEHTLGPNGRPRVRYKDMPEMDPKDMDVMIQKFNSMACPHAAVLEYRPGYEGRGYTQEHARDCWWMYDSGVTILHGLRDLLDGPHKDALNAAFDDLDYDVRKALSTMDKYLALETMAQFEVALKKETGVEDLRLVDRAELDAIEDSIIERWTEMVEGQEARQRAYMSNEGRD